MEKKYSKIEELAKLADQENRVTCKDTMSDLENTSDEEKSRFRRHLETAREATSGAFNAIRFKTPITPAAALAGVLAFSPVAAKAQEKTTTEPCQITQKKNSNDRLVTDKGLEIPCIYINEAINDGSYKLGKHATIRIKLGEHEVQLTKGKIIYSNKFADEIPTISIEDVKISPEGKVELIKYAQSISIGSRHDGLIVSTPARDYTLNKGDWGEFTNDGALIDTTNIVENSADSSPGPQHQAIGCNTINNPGNEEEPMLVLIALAGLIIRRYRNKVVNQD